ncbi:MAG: hypothetical protein IPJ61_08115 [Tessaracoccus sp.]|uniref:hypothetical protein n=1 Tax=Tessaracoccus sp. TaxID=1971211 RepID=UPI001EBD5E91|nr:hypothetical protein [Tessaracoccus sp.]MBK7821029.1 hypothetical protein [Tessaracoccus sp.]
MSMDTQPSTDMEEPPADLASAQQTDLDDPEPRELESALLSLALFGGLILFGIGCMVFGWN